MTFLCSIYTIVIYTLFHFSTEIERLKERRSKGSNRSSLGQSNDTTTDDNHANNKHFASTAESESDHLVSDLGDNKTTTTVNNGNKNTLSENKTQHSQDHNNKLTETVERKTTDLSDKSDHLLEVINTVHDPYNNKTPITTTVPLTSDRAPAERSDVNYEECQGVEIESSAGDVGLSVGGVRDIRSDGVVSMRGGEHTVGMSSLHSGSDGSVVECDTVVFNTIKTGAHNKLCDQEYDSGIGSSSNNTSTKSKPASSTTSQENTSQKGANSVSSFTGSSTVISGHLDSGKLLDKVDMDISNVMSSSAIVQVDKQVTENLNSSGTGLSKQQDFVTDDNMNECEPSADTLKVCVKKNIEMWGIFMD